MARKIPRKRGGIVMSETALLFLLAFGFGLAMALIKHPFYGLYTYIGTFYLHPPSRWWGAELPELRWSLIAACVTLLAMVRLPRSAERLGWLSTTGPRILLIYVAYMWLQTPFALSFEDQVEGLTLFTKYLILTYLICRLVRTEEDVTNFLMAHIVGCFYFGYMAFGSTFSGGRLEGVGGPGIDDSNTMSMHMATGAVCAAMIMLARTDWRRYVCLAGMPFILNTIVLAGSRGSFLGLLGSAGVVASFRNFTNKKLFWAMATLGIILFGLLAHETFWERMGTIDDAARSPTTVDTSVESRVELFKAQFEMFKDHPLGAGHNGTAIQSAAHLDRKYLSKGARASHNTFMAMLINQGIVGAILYLSIVIWVFRSVVRLRRNLKDTGNPIFAAHLAAVGGSLTVTLLAGIFTNYLKAEVQIWMIALLASLLIMNRNTTPIADVAEKQTRQRSHGRIRSGA